MLRIAALLSFALVITLVGGVMTINADLSGSVVGAYALESN